MSKTIVLDKDVNEYIEKQHSPQREICQKVRQIIFETLPEVREQMKWGVPAYDDGTYYFVALKTHVNLGFSIKGLSVEEIALFDGGGKTMKHLKIDDLNDMDEIKIVKLLRLVHEQ